MTTKPAAPRHGPPPQGHESLYLLVLPDGDSDTFAAVLTARCVRAGRVATFSLWPAYHARLWFLSCERAIADEARRIAGIRIRCQAP